MQITTVTKELCGRFRNTARVEIVSIVGGMAEQKQVPPLPLTPVLAYTVTAALSAVNSAATDLSMWSLPRQAVSARCSWRKTFSHSRTCLDCAS